MICFLVSLSLCVALPKQAFAYQTCKTYSWKTNINASIGTNGTINVTETKIIDITPFIEKAKKHSQSNSNEKITPKLSPLVWSFWDFPEESDVQLSDAKIAILSNNDSVVGNWSAINTSDYLSKWNDTESPNNDTYTFDKKNKQMCLFTSLMNPQQYNDEECYNIVSAYTGTNDVATWNFTKAIINLNYSILCAPKVYKDVVDFKWNYCQDTWQMDSYDVTLNVTVPVGNQSIASPLGKISNNANDAGATTERNIYAWGHGSSTGILDLNPSGIISLNNNIVPGGSNAEVRIVFPSSWLTNLDSNINISQTNQTKLTTILKEESVWRDDRTDRVNKMLIPIMLSILSILFLGLTIAIKLRLDNKFSEKSIKEKDLDDVHPCVLVRLKNWNHKHSHDIVAAILNLNQNNLLKIKRMASGDFEIKLKDKNLAIDPYKDKNMQIIDIRTINFLFHEIACSNPLLRLSDINNYAKARSYSFMSKYLTWHSLLTDEVNQFANFKSQYDRTRKVIFILSLIWLIFALIIAFIFKDTLTAIIGAFSTFVISFLANSMRNKIKVINDEGKNIHVKDIKVKFSNYTKTEDSFRKAAISAVHNAVLDAQDINAACQLTQ